MDAVKAKPARRTSSAPARIALPALDALPALVALVALVALAAVPACAESAEPDRPATTPTAAAPATTPAVATTATVATSAAAAPATTPATTAADARVEARSAQLLAVGTVHGERMTIHLSRLEDNAPVRDAEVALVLRGATHPATALADGGYSVATPDLALPGAAAVRVKVTSGGIRQDLEGTLQAAAAPEPAEDKGSSRQLGWWVLNFAVCIGFLWLWQRRKRHDPDEEAQG